MESQVYPALERQIATFTRATAKATEPKAAEPKPEPKPDTKPDTKEVVR